MTSKGGASQKVWIDTAPFCTMGYIKDVSVLFEDTTLQIVTVDKTLKNSIQNLQSISLSTLRDLGSYRILSIQALCSIAFGEKLLAHYGNRYR